MFWNWPEGFAAVNTGFVIVVEDFGTKFYFEIAVPDHDKMQMILMGFGRNPPKSPWDNKEIERCLFWT